MDNFKSWFEGLLHKGHQHELIGDIEHEIVSKLLELDFSGWWRSVKNVPKEELARFNKMWDVIDNNSPIDLDVGSDTTSFYNDTDRIKDAIDSMGSEIESDYIDFLASQNDNQVKKVMDGHRFRTLKESFTLPVNSPSAVPPLSVLPSQVIFCGNGVEASPDHVRIGFPFLSAT